MEIYFLEWLIVFLYLAIWWMNLGLVDAKRTQPIGMHSAKEYIGPISPVKGNVNATSYKDIVALSTFQLCHQFGEGPFMFQHDNVPVHKASSITHSTKVWCGGTRVACTEPWPRPHTFGMNWKVRSEIAGQTILSNISAWPHKWPYSVCIQVNFINLYPYNCLWFCEFWRTKLNFCVPGQGLVLTSL